MVTKAKLSCCKLVFPWEEKNVACLMQHYTFCLHSLWPNGYWNLTSLLFDFCGITCDYIMKSPGQGSGGITVAGGFQEKGICHTEGHNLVGMMVMG